MLTYRLQGRLVTVPAVILVQLPDRLRMELQDPVGSLLGLLVIEGGRFWLYRHDAKENLTGPLARLPASLGLPLQAERIARVFLARPELNLFEPAGQGHQRSATGEALELDGAELKAWRLPRPGQGEFSAEYEAYESRQGTLYPIRLRLREPQRGDTVLVAWKEWEPSVPEDKKLFQIPQQQQFGRPTKALR